MGFIDSFSVKQVFFPINFLGRTSSMLLTKIVQFSIEKPRKHEWTNGNSNNHEWNQKPSLLLSRICLVLQFFLQVQNWIIPVTDNMNIRVRTERFSGHPQDGEGGGGGKGKKFFFLGNEKKNFFLFKKFFFFFLNFGCGAGVSPPPPFPFTIRFFYAFSICVQEETLCTLLACLCLWFSRAKCFKVL